MHNLLKNLWFKKKLMNDESPSEAKVKLALLRKMINRIVHHFLEMKRKYEKRCEKWRKDNTVWKSLNFSTTHILREIIASTKQVTILTRN